MEAEELGAWLRLTQAPGLGGEAVRRLLSAYGGPERVLAAGAGGWSEVAGTAAAAALAAPLPEWADGQLDKTLAWLAAAPGQRHVLSLGDPAYPAALLNTADPPALLFAQGRLALLASPSLAIVGSRHATPQGLENAHAFAAHLSKTGLTIVSGLALGVDGAAHQGALTGAGSTIAVVGTGLDLVYPSRHKALAHRIAEHGLLLSEFALGTPSISHHFPRRNRVIAGLSAGTLVVEAALQSGSLITARLALECGREVFAIPGSIHSPQSKGCHRLIKEGAKLVETADDILQELRFPVRGTPAAPAAAAEDGHSGQAEAVCEGRDDEAETPGSERDQLLAAIGHDPVTLDALSARTGWPADRLNVMLLELELDGHLARLPGGLLQRRSAA